MSEVSCPLGESAKRRPEARFVVTAGREWSYREANEAVNRRAEVLAGLRKRFGGGRRLALLIPQGNEDTRTVEVIWTLLAAGRAGLTALMLDDRLPESMLRALLAPEQGIMVVGDEDRIRKVAAEGVTWEELKRLEEGSGGGLVEAGRVNFIWDLAREATGVLTSGSTGVPKLCLQTFGNQYYSALGSNENIRLVEGDRWLLALPLYHVGGMAILFRVMLAGASVAVGDVGSSLAEQIRSLKVTHCSMVPMQLRRYIAEGDGVAGLKAVLIGGAAAPRGVIEAATDRGLPIFTSYGLTEMCSQVTTTAPGDPRERLFGSGRLLPHRELRTDESGEILVRGRTLSPGYLEREGFRGIGDAEGWFHTGDTGELDAKGYLRVTGRKDNMLVSGGENVQPELVEKGLLELPGITEAVVVAVEDREYGQRPFAFVSFAQKDPREFARATRLVRDYVLLTGGRVDTPVQVREVLKEKIPAYAVPVRVAPMPEEARQGLKVDRKYLERAARELYDG